VSESYYLKCMGVPELFGPDGRVVRMKGQKHLALLVYLAVERRSQYRRDELADLLWSEHQMPEARHSLATAVSAIRRVFGPSVITGNRDLLRFEHRRVILDVERLEAQEVLATATLPAVEIGGFLADSELRAPPAFLHWRDRQQSRWQPYIKGGLLKLIDHSRRTGASLQIGRLADQLIALDSLAEDGPRAKMEALAFAGDRISALRVFEEWRERLHTELGAVPSPLVEEMARRLRRRGVERPVADQTPTVQVDPWRARPFVGRAHEYRVMYEAWESVKLSAPRHVLVEGESGIGKSTLVERFAVAASLEGAIVARAQCYELERAIPFAAIASLTASLLDKPGVSSTDPASLAEVARVIPKVRERFPGLPMAMDTQGETARLHFAEGIMAMLEAAMEEHPVVLVMDDFHLADEVSLTVLHLLIRRIEVGRLMVLLTIRSSELQQGSGAARVHGGGEYLRMAKLLLPPLTEAESEELLARLVPADQPQPAASHRRALLLAARGVPMVLQLLVDDWQRNGTAGLALSLGAMTERVGSGGPATSEGTYRHIIERMLFELDPVTRLVLHTATVLSSRINDLSLYQVGDLTTSQTMIGMAELTGRHILRDAPTGLDFVNELVRGQAYGSMPGPLRQGLHAAVAQRLLARLAAGDRDVRGLETAWHLVRGGRAGEAAPHLLRGAREAIHGGAPHEAEMALSTALSDDAVLRGEDRTEALLLLSEVMQELSNWEGSLAQLKELPHGLTSSQVERAELFSIIANHHMAQRDARNQHDVINRLISMAEDATDPLVRARSSATAAYFLEQMQAQVQPDRLWKAIDALATLEEPPEAVAYVFRAKATLRYLRREILLSKADTASAIHIHEENRVFSSAYIDLIIAESALHCALGQYDSAQAPAKKAYELAKRLDNEHLASRAAINVALVAGRRGHYDEQIRWGEVAINHMSLHPNPNALVLAAISVGLGKAMDYSQDTLEAFGNITARIQFRDYQWLRQATSLLEADIQQLLGRKRKALSAARDATSGENQILHSLGWAGRFARWVAMIGIADNRKQEAAKQLDAIVTDFDRYDALDRVEIAGAYLLLNGPKGRDAGWLRESAITLLSSMPPAVSEQLDRLGILSTLVRDAKQL
jgi:DNA-binding SARP family transcriptional activator/tetratricopeptide (TPR) repeat protein